ncbi:PREDICTED: uncharacterized protein LOC108769339 [Trachymyrmex cornetzi]|uniref:uncharacterized protein LOC108769339 n=1 Tax=Trachymyrmex cornetzi TaxID=471704 RepID=UPI00084EDBF4|nr:PREDICTED: uncharacterized protein LOC108769339 [Trachymyrmex cornetzi]
MKTFILFMCLLAVAYAGDNTNGNTLCDLLELCTTEVSKCRNTPFLCYYNVIIDHSIWYCILQKAHVLNADGTINKKAGIGFCDVAVDQNYVDTCKELVKDCLYEDLDHCLKGRSQANCQIDCIRIKGVMDHLIQCKEKQKKNA